MYINEQVIMADCLYRVCDGNTFFAVRDIVLNIRVLGVCELVSFRDQTCILKCMSTNKYSNRYKFGMENVRPQMDKTTAVLNCFLRDWNKVLTSIINGLVTPLWCKVKYIDFRLENCDNIISAISFLNSYGNIMGYFYDVAHGQMYKNW